MTLKIASYMIPVFIIVSLFLNRSCAPLVVGAAAGAGVVAYNMGELKTTDEVSLDRAWIASQAAVDAMGFHVTNREHDAVDGVLEATGANDKDISIRLHSISPNLTEIRIRVDVFGNEDLSRRILSEIRRRY
ncbi:MAG: DUF3568 family protein [bacterium]|jgi:hypothetical protein